MLTDEELAAEARAKDAYEHSFLVLSDKWLEGGREGWSPQTHEKYVFIVQDRFQPEIGMMDMRTMRTKDVRPVLLALKSKTPSIASKAVTCLHGVVQHCINEGIREDDQFSD